MRVLLISYFFKPYKGVGALRPTYWAEHMNEVDKNLTLDVITAQKDVAERDLPGGGTVITVEDKYRSFLSKFIRFDSGVNWKIALKEYFLSSESRYDVAILTGGPFLHFSIIKQIKKKLNCKVILDFRDPFANSPNMKMVLYKRWIKNYLEKKFINNADEIITVNSICSTLLNNTSKKAHIIDNGYDDLIVDKILNNNNNVLIKDQNRHKIIYPGKFYKGASPEIFFKLIMSPVLGKDFVFKYIGEDYKTVPLSSNISVSKQMPYREVLENVHQADTGLIFTGGEPFESTTKIFDYIGLGKNILIVTNGEVRTGVINEISKNYPNVFWSENKEDSIRKSLLKIKEIKGSFYYKDREKYSRKEGLRELINIIKGI